MTTTIKIAGYHTAQDDRDDRNAIFIDKDLDDSRLDPYAFRVYHRIARRAGRGEAFESNKNMAKGCCISEAQVKRSLKFLVDHGFIVKQARPGDTCIYRVTPKSNWYKNLSENSPFNTDRSGRSIRKSQKNKVSKNTSNVRICLVELGGRSGRARKVGLVELQSRSLLSRSNKDLQSVVEKFEEQEEAVHDNHLVDKKSHNSGNNAVTHEDRNSAPLRENHSQNEMSSHNETHYQNWQCPDPRLYREFMGWLSETVPHIKTARHAANWCKKNPQDADLAWDDFMKSRDRRAAKIASFTNWHGEQHQMLVSQYKAAQSTPVLMENFVDRNSDWLEWVHSNHPEWLEEIA